ncbi:MAG: FtsQ-type POTRA domain-containing protein [Cyanobacteria bacterium J06627_8]
MSDLTALSRVELERRRRQKRWQKRWQLVKLLWQTICVSSLTGGILVGVAHSNWIIRSPEQIEVDGMNLLSKETVRALIPITYPELIFAIDPGVIGQQLQIQGPIDTVEVERQLFPPSLSIRITERRPVAVLLGNTYTNPFATEHEQTWGQRATPSAISPSGLLDENGNWLPLASYDHVRDEVELPSLNVIGMQASYRQLWRSLYPIIRSSPVEIHEVNLRDPSNLILNTTLGAVHVGPYQEADLRDQLTLLDKLRYLSDVVDLDNVAHIDLTQIETPMLEFKRTAPQYEQTILRVPVPQHSENTYFSNDGTN